MNTKFKNSTICIDNNTSQNYEITNYNTDILNNSKESVSSEIAKEYKRGRKYYNNTDVKNNKQNRNENKTNKNRTKNYVDAPRRVKPNYNYESCCKENQTNNNKSNTIDDQCLTDNQKCINCIINNKNCKSISTYTRTTSNSFSNKSDNKSIASLNNKINNNMNNNNNNNNNNNCSCCSNALNTSEEDSDNTLSNEVYKILCDVYSANINNNDISELINICYSSVSEFCAKEEQNEILIFVKILFDKVLEAMFVR